VTAKKPTRLRVLSGSTRTHPERNNPAEPKPEPGMPKPPPWLPTTGPARDAWRRLAPILLELHVLTLADGDGLALICLAEADLIEARRDPNGWRRGDAAWKRLRLGMADFGLNPSARAKVSVVPPATADPTEAWVRQGEAAKPTRPGGPK
jgi:phage terminase small subunit